MLRPNSFLLRSCLPSSGRTAFSLLEMLFVLAIVAGMFALLVPAIAAAAGANGRRGAVNVVMNALEHARVAALEQGREVHVVFARRQFPEPDALLVVRNDGDDAPVERLTHWVALPKGILFRDLGVFEDAAPPVTVPELAALGPTGTIDKIGVLTFAPSGIVQHPKGNDNSRRIHLAHGTRPAGGADIWKSEGFDIISVARYTGRPQLDVTFN